MSRNITRKTVCFYNLIFFIFFMWISILFLLLWHELRDSQSQSRYVIPSKLHLSRFVPIFFLRSGNDKRIRGFKDDASWYMFWALPPLLVLSFLIMLIQKARTNGAFCLFRKAILISPSHPFMRWVTALRWPAARRSCTVHTPHQRCSERLSRRDYRKRKRRAHRPNKTYRTESL